MLLMIGEGTGEPPDRIICEEQKSRFQSRLFVTEMSFLSGPSHFNSGPPCGEIDDHNVMLRFSGVDLKSDQVRSQINAELNNIKGYLASLTPEVNSYNNSLGQTARTAIEARKRNFCVTGILFRQSVFHLSRAQICRITNTF